MSGITGIYNLDGCPVAPALLEQMTQRLAHRGPDGTHTWVEGACGLGHRMLWTTPESLLEKLPSVHERGDFVITADARIDNREDLAKVLNLPQRPLEKITDSDFILAAYETWGEQCPEYLVGDFAFAIWDQRQQHLFCARDHFGVKPFYYHASARLFTFASEMKALLCLPDVPRRLNEVRLGDYLTLTLEDQVITIYQDIQRLPPATSLVISPAGMRSWSYWHLDAQRELSLDSDAAYAATFRQIFTEAVQCRLRTAFPIGSHLSGGLDSSSVTCVARNLLEPTPQTLHTLSLTFDVLSECDERSYINTVLEQGDLIPHYIPGDQISPVSNLDEVFEYEDEALLGPGHFYPWYLDEMAHKQGLRVCLDGFDGDTVVGHGVARLAELALQGQWQTFAHEAKAVAINFTNFNTSPLELLAHYGLPCLTQFVRHGQWIKFMRSLHEIHHYFGVSRKALLKDYGLKAIAPAPVLHLWQKVRGRASTDPAPPLLANPTFAKRVGLEQRMQALQRPESGLFSARAQQHQSLTSGVIAYALEQADQYAARFSLEMRHPFLDKRLVEFCLALPAEQKMCDGWTRMVMRRGMAGILPEAIQWRQGKMNATPNFNDGLVNRDRHRLDAILAAKLHHIAGVADLQVFQAAYQRLTTQKSGSNQDRMTVWQITSLITWLEHHGMTL
jgi:asparagine synthase (glutamine-hydrolysing)